MIDYKRVFRTHATNGTNYKINAYNKSIAAVYTKIEDTLFTLPRMNIHGMVLHELLALGGLPLQMIMEYVREV